MLEKIDGTWQNASVRGKLYPQGWGAALGYPGIVIDAAGKTVSGFLFTSSQLADYWEALDEFEGEGYKRILTTVELDSGEKVEAFVYALKNRPSF